MKTKSFLFALLILVSSVSLFAQTTFTADSKDGRNQATFQSDAPLEKIVGVASGVDAMVMINPSDITNMPKGKVKVPIGNLKTGIDLRDEHLRSENWLDAGKYPFAEFMLTGISNASSKSLENGKKTTATLEGKLTIHGVTRDVKVPGEFFFLKESEKTKAKMPGNLLRASTNFNIKLSDYGVKVPDMVAGKVSEEVAVSMDFIASDSNAGGGNPCGACNPCAMDKGKCNPCKMKK